MIMITSDGRFKVAVVETVHQDRFGIVAGQTIEIWEWAKYVDMWIHKVEIRQPALIDGQRPTEHQVAKWIISELSKYLNPADLVEAEEPDEWEKRGCASRCPSFIP